MLAPPGHGHHEGAGDLSDGLSWIFCTGICCENKPTVHRDPLSLWAGLSAHRWSNKGPVHPHHVHSLKGWEGSRAPGLGRRQGRDSGSCLCLCSAHSLYPSFQREAFTCLQILPFQAPLVGMRRINIFICVCRRVGSVCVSIWRGRKRNDVGIRRREQPVPLGYGSRSCCGVPAGSLEMDWSQSCVCWLAGEVAACPLWCCDTNCLPGALFGFGFAPRHGQRLLLFVAPTVVSRALSSSPPCCQPGGSNPKIAPGIINGC